MQTTRHVRMLILVSLCTIFLATPGMVLGRTIYVDDDALGAQDGSSWASAFRYLRDALVAASAGDEIWVAQGLYRPDQGAQVVEGSTGASFLLVDGVAIKGGFAGLMGADPDLRDPGLFTTILTGDLGGDDDPNSPPGFLDNNSHTVVTARGVQSTLDGVTVTRGFAVKGNGGGVSCIAANFLARNCTFLENYAEEKGGGIHSFDGTVRLENCRFLRNRAWYRGGGLCNEIMSSAQVIDCEFIDNHSAEVAGGAANDESSNAIFFHCTFRGNSCSDCSGAILNSGVIRLLYCTFADNRALEDAGAVSCMGGSATIAHCLFHNNTGEDGGAIYLDGGASVSLSQCTLYGNGATEHAAGVHCRPASRWADQYVPAASLHASGCIFWANRALNYDGTDRTTGYEAQIDGDPNQIVVEYCCIEGWTPAHGGAGNIGDDPFFVGPDAGDFHLKSQAGHWDAVLQAWVPDDVTSPCIDAGDPLIAVEHELFPNGGIVNMGAYGGTCEASKSWFGTEPCQTVNAADINGDCRVDAEDYRLIVLRWLQPAPSE